MNTSHVSNSDHSGFPIVPDPAAQWWGRDTSKRWVVLDREWTANQLDPRGNLLFVNCEGWTLFSDSFRNWRPPSTTYVFVNRYLEALSAGERDRAQSELNELVHAYAHRRLDLAKLGLDERLSEFRRRTGRLVARLGWADSTNHRRPCWNCERRFNSELELRCQACGWFACWDCGRCGCTWPGLRASWRRGSPGAAVRRIACVDYLHQY